MDQIREELVPTIDGCGNMTQAFFRSHAIIVVEVSHARHACATQLAFYGFTPHSQVTSAYALLGLQLYKLMIHVADVCSIDKYIK